MRTEGPAMPMARPLPRKRPGPMAVPIAIMESWPEVSDRWRCWPAASVELTCVDMDSHVEHSMYGGGVDDSTELVDGVLELVLRGVEVRRDADAGAGAVVDEDLAPQKLCSDTCALGYIEDDDATTPSRIALAANGDAGLVSKFDEPCGLANGLGANGVDADLIHDLIAGARGVEAGDIGSAAEEAEGVRRVVDGAALEVEGRAMRLPTDSGGFKQRP